MRYQYVTIPVSREWLARELPHSARLGVAIAVATGLPRSEAVAQQGRRTGYMVADRPAWPTFRLFRRLP